MGLLFTLFYGFSGGTRNVFAIYLVLFVAAYMILRKNITWTQAAMLLCVAAGLLYFSAYYMLQFRTIGLGGLLSREARLKVSEEKPCSSTTIFRSSAG